MVGKGDRLDNDSNCGCPANLAGLEVGVEISKLLIILLKLSLRKQPKYIQDIVEELEWYLGRRRIRI